MTDTHTTDTDTTDNPPTAVVNSSTTQTSGAAAATVAPLEPRAAFMALLAPIKGSLVAACIVQACASIVGLAPFIAVAELAREFLGSGPIDDARVWTITWIAVGSLVLRFVLLFAAGAITHFADNNFQLHIRRRLVDRLGRAPLGWFSERSGGEVKKAVADDVAAMHHVVGHSFNEMTAAIVTPFAALVYMFSVDWRFTLVALVPVLIGIALYAKQMSGYGEKMQAYNQALGDVNTAAVEFVQGIAVVKSFGETGRAHRRFLDATNRFVDYFWDWVRGLVRIASASEVAMAPLSGLLVVAGAGTLFVGNGWIDAVDLVPFFLLGLAIAAPVLALGYSANDMQTASLAAVRVARLLETESMPTTNAPQLPDGNRVVFDGVGFSYDGEHDVLHDIDLVLDPGTVTALVGPSGSGKSTIAKLVCRFWDPTRGAVTLGGADVRNVDPDELYRHVGFVFQDVQLLKMSVRDNIALGRPTATDDDVIAAARAAQIHDRIERLDRGYDSIVGVDALFSGGEAQRVSIARALLADAPIVVLDEATAFADPESEASIQDALSSLVAGRTLLVVAHRLHTIVGADQILVIDNGRIVERGRHGTLLAQDGLYRSLWDKHEQNNATNGQR